MTLHAKVCMWLVSLVKVRVFSLGSQVICPFHGLGLKGAQDLIVAAMEPRSDNSGEA